MGAPKTEDSFFSGWTKTILIGLGVAVLVGAAVYCTGFGADNWQKPPTFDEDKWFLDKANKVAKAKDPAYKKLVKKHIKWRANKKRYDALQVGNDGKPIYPEGRWEQVKAYFYGPSKPVQAEYAAISKARNDIRKSMIDDDFRSKHAAAVNEAQAKHY